MPEKNFFDSPELRKIQIAFQEASEAYRKNADNFWENLSDEDKLYAFYSVCKRIYEGEVEQRGSYRYVLYDVFQFGPESYMVGMECNYMQLHNLIGAAVDANKKDA